MTTKVSNATCRERQTAQIEGALEGGCDAGKNRSHRLIRMLVAGVMTFALVPVALTGCGSTAANNTTTNTTTEASSSSSSSIDLSVYDLEYTDRDLDPSYDASSAVSISLTGTSATASTTDGVSISGGTVTISKEGVYVVSGTLSDGQIVVDCNEADNAKVQIVLNGANITCGSGSAIYVQEAKKVFLTLAAGSSNTVSDASAYTLNQDDGSANAAIYSKCNLTLQGSGALTINGNYKHGVFSKDELVITGGTYNVTSVADALRGKDCLKIKDGTFTINSGEDAVKSSNSDEEGKGFVAIDGGTFNVTAGDDAFHAETLMLVNGGTLNVAQCYEGLEGQVIVVNDGTIAITASDDGLNAATGGTGDSQASDPGAAGMNHKQNIDANGGTMDDARGGSAGAGGATGAGATQGASTTKASYSTASTASTSTVAMGAAGGGMMDGDSNCMIQINGGYLLVSASGDGIDSNGSVEITGGVILVDGPTSGGDAAFDYGLNATISGGTIIACGSSSMAENLTGGTQAFCLANASGTAGQSVAVCDASGNVLASFTPSKQFQCVLVSAPGMTDGTSYNLVIGGTVSGANANGYASSGTVTGGSAYSFTASTSDSSNSLGGGMPSGMGGGMGSTASPQGDWGGGAGGGTAPSGTPGGTTAPSGSDTAGGRR